PQEMAYYNPLNASNELFVSRIEEYFYDVFTTADQDSSIFFGNYEHFMIIHAGSDWQHDINGDTPCDLPSFFIRVGTGKEVVVDNGATVIKHACNVPETITQDAYEIVEDDYTYVYGYGATNAVYAHEFGHSLGLVDLYNTTNSRPMVGVFDIMDSGGQGMITIQDNYDPNKYFAIEGALPMLPGAWSRNLIFGDFFREKGITRAIDADFIDFSQDLKIRAAEAKYKNDNTPHFYKVALSDKEYLLLENKSIDPDEDGGTTIKSALNGRIALYPCPYVGDEPSYEYDWLLPSWMDMYGRWYGGGLLIWHIDDEIIYDKGIIDSDGEFYSNYQNNTVNIRFAERGVRVIEADNLEDIGNPYSYFWTGTEYEFFFKNKPILDENGLFVNWSFETHNDSLSALTTPALKTNKNTPSSWAIHAISRAKPVMNFRLANAIFDNTIALCKVENVNAISPATNFVGDTATDLLISGEDESVFWSHNYSMVDDSWSTFWSLEEAINPVYPIIKVDLKQSGVETLLITEIDKIKLVSQDVYQEFAMNRPVTNSPFVFYQDANVMLLVPFADETVLYRLDKIGSNYQLVQLKNINSTGKLAGVEHSIIIQAADELVLLNMELDEIARVGLSETHADYEPVLFANSNGNIEIFIMSDKGKITCLQSNNLSEKQVIFDVSHSSDSLPSQLALAIDNEQRLILSFAAGNTAFMILNDGTFVNKFPQRLSDFTVKEKSFVTVLQKDNDLISVFNAVNDGFVGINNRGVIDFHNTMFWQKGDIEPVWFKEHQSNRLYILYTDVDNNVFLAYRSLRAGDDLVWNGYRNGDRGAIAGSIVESVSEESMLAYVYPNPVINDNCRIRIENAKSDINIKIYNIAGDLVLDKLLNKSHNIYQDYQFENSRLTSGVYYAIVTSGKEYKRIKFAVIK
ncbi:MAG: T9SS type A sorting domain-containing protein, partial [Candidatus Cloacimonetes bacterium]|nr:T9SS type A sorting domain-containing protein [Candidatus Cloacimonadota bacterium]